MELGLRQISFQSKMELKCFYKGRELKKRYVPDLFVSGLFGSRTQSRHRTCAGT